MRTALPLLDKRLGAGTIIGTMALAQILSITLLVVPVTVATFGLLFWLWMFRDMYGNENVPPCFITLTSGRNPRFDWTFTFAFLSLLAAVCYYMAEYRNRD